MSAPGRDDIRGDTCAVLHIDADWPSLAHDGGIAGLAPPRLSAGGWVDQPFCAGLLLDHCRSGPGGPGGPGRGATEQPAPPPPAAVALPDAGTLALLALSLLAALIRPAGGAA